MFVVKENSDVELAKKLTDLTVNLENIIDDLFMFNTKNHFIKTEIEKFLIVVGRLKEGIDK